MLSETKCAYVPVPEALLPEVYRFLAELTANPEDEGGPDTSLAESLEENGVGWQAVNLAQLVNTATATTQLVAQMLDVLAEDPGRLHPTSELIERLGVSQPRLRGGLAALTRHIKRHYPELGWPMTVEWGSDLGEDFAREAYYALSPEVAAAWKEVRDSDNDTVIVPAADAWPEYQWSNAYVCQPNRSFRDGLTHLGFYTNKAIQPLVPRIRVRHTNVLFTREQANGWRDAGNRAVGDLIDLLLDHGPRTEGEAFDVFLLSAPDDAQTVQLAHPIENDLVSTSGRPAAWVQNQRYARLDHLTSGATHTSQV